MKIVVSPKKIKKCVKILVISKKLFTFTTRSRSITTFNLKSNLYTSINSLKRGFKKTKKLTNMKSLFTILLSTLFLTTVSAADTLENFKIGSSKQSTIEAKFTTTIATDALITITNESGEIINTQKVKVIKGNNNISLINIANLAEGKYTVQITINNKISTANFINLKMD